MRRALAVLALLVLGWAGGAAAALTCDQTAVELRTAAHVAEFMALRCASVKNLRVGADVRPPGGGRAGGRLPTGRDLRLCSVGVQHVMMTMMCGLLDVC